jgi:(p)ppGpp synthase/HD superfamily hydrolase
MLERAISIAVDCHKGFQDKADKPYILHPLRVMFKMKTEEEMIVAVLHDVVEDCKEWTFEKLLNEGFSKKIIDALDHVTWREADDEKYEDFIQRVKKNNIAIKVKIADLEDNMDVKRLSQISDKDQKRLNKYLNAWRDIVKMETY